MIEVETTTTADDHMLAALRALEEGADAVSVNGVRLDFRLSEAALQGLKGPNKKRLCGGWRAQGVSLEPIAGGAVLRLPKRDAGLPAIATSYADADVTSGQGFTNARSTRRRHKRLMDQMDAAYDAVRLSRGDVVEIGVLTADHVEDPALPDIDRERLFGTVRVTRADGTQHPLETKIIFRPRGAIESDKGLEALTLADLNFRAARLEGDSPAASSAKRLERVLSERLAEMVDALKFDLTGGWDENYIRTVLTEAAGFGFALKAAEDESRLRKSKRTAYRANGAKQARGAASKTEALDKLIVKVVAYCDPATIAELAKVVMDELEAENEKAYDRGEPVKELRDPKTIQRGIRRMREAGRIDPSKIVDRKAKGGTSSRKF